MPIILKAICFTAAFLLFAYDAIKGGRAGSANRLDWALIPAGLALFVLPFAVDAWDAVD